jgi:enamine deaminase RidA (YjgF/YER057c/UK114 family)
VTLAHAEGVHQSAIVVPKPGPRVLAGSRFDSASAVAKPATTWIGVVSLADPGFLIEIEAVAVLE